jgi:hypothetical protein
MIQPSGTPTSSNPPTFPRPTADEDSRPNRHHPFTQDRAISRIMQQLCGIQAFQAGFEISSMSALARLSDLAIGRKLSLI